MNMKSPNAKSQPKTAVSSGKKSGNSPENTLKIIPLGGLGEIGKNTMAICYGDDIMLVDAGLAFPTEEMLGVDLVLPDLSFLIENQTKVRGLAITHGHEDHIGGIPFILKEITIPTIYGPALALGLLEGKLREWGLEERTSLCKVRPRQQVKIGCFTVQFIRCTHSIADSFSLIIRTPVGTLIHTGDFKFDFTPVDGELFDIASISAAAEEGILLLMSDSTNTEREGYTPSERTVWRKLNEVFANARQRIVVTTFASNVHRIRQVLQAAMKYDRKVAILGRSMMNLANIARELGYMTFPDGLLLSVDQINQLPPDRVVILTTGSQGEPLSALTRIANDEHKQLKIFPGDTVIISATPIPGNERSVANTINALFLRGADVIYGKEAGVHVSGHACREEQKLMINICRPKFFMPIHGEYRMLVSHTELAAECGVPPENSFIMENGDVLELTADSGGVTGRVKAGVILIDSSRAWQVNEQIIQERRHLAEDGLVTVALTLATQRSKIVALDVSLKGLILPSSLSSEELVTRIKAELSKILLDRTAVSKLNKDDLQSFLQGCLNGFFSSRIRALPFIQVIVHEVAGEEQAKKTKNARPSASIPKSGPS
ncbi:MAG: ribonuclease J [Candidatus Melainabacteria bacterium]|nr:MAG: ribonuclease J [Candidatus Melainabacteria bacterium]